MGLPIVGKLHLIIGRSVITSADSTYPSGASQSGSVAVPARAKGARTHVLIDATGSGSTVAFVGSVWGYLTETNTWYSLGNVIDDFNNSTTVSLTTTLIDDGNNIHYAVALDHASAFDRLWVGFSSLTAVTSLTQRFGFEGLHDR